jgi:hypothetical protein
MFIGIVYELKESTMSVIEASGADLAFQAGPTPKEMSELKERGFRCNLPRDAYDEIGYNVGALSCRVVPVVEGVDPSADANDVFFIDATVEPPVVVHVNEAPLTRKLAVVTAIHKLHDACLPPVVMLPQAS